MPERRYTWTQKTRIGGHAYYASFGEREDGQLGEVFVTGGVFGSYERGILDSLSRVVSISLQCGVPPEEVAEALCGINFAPNGPTEDGFDVLSVTDWMGQLIRRAYVPDSVRESALPQGSVASDPTAEG